MRDRAFVDRLNAILGARNVLTGPRATERYRKGFRSGEGEAICVVRPGTLLEQWQVLEACVTADKIVIMQAANTGLTEGSTPSGRYDRDVVLINTRRMDRIVTLDSGRQVIAFPGATLFALEKLLAPLRREPHSVIGSSCIGASIVGGVCNSSGGSLVERGPSYTELSLFAQLNADGRLQLINHLGVDLGEPRRVAVLPEALGVDEPVDPLAHGPAPARVLLVDRLLAAELPREPAPRLDLVDLVLPAHGPMRLPQNGGRSCASCPAASARASPSLR